MKDRLHVGSGWKYVDSNETKKPGYLQRRFAAIRAEQKRAETIKTSPKVRQLVKRAEK